MNPKGGSSSSNNPLQKPPRQTELGGTGAVTAASMATTAGEYSHSNDTVKINGTLYKAAGDQTNPDLIPQIHRRPPGEGGSSSGDEEQSGKSGFISSLKRKKRKAAVTESTEHFATSGVDMGRNVSNDMLHGSPTVTNTTLASSSFELDHSNLNTLSQPHIYANQLSSDALYPQNSFSPNPSGGSSTAPAPMWVDNGRSPVLTHRDHLMSRSGVNNPTANSRTLGLSLIHI